MPLVLGFSPSQSTHAYIVQLLLVVVVVTIDVCHGTELDCPRWRCPCVGSRSRDSVGMLYKRSASFSNTAIQARKLTQDLLHTMNETRFHRNKDHVESLMQCVEKREPGCFEMHLAEECTMETLPHLVSQELKTPGNLPGDLHQASLLLSTLAVYVEQARHDEAARPGDSHVMIHDITRLEEIGIYHLLCNVETSFFARGLPYDPQVSHQIMDENCRTFARIAAQDNRNFMVFLALEKLLNDLELTFGNADEQEW